MKFMDPRELYGMVEFIHPDISVCELGFAGRGVVAKSSSTSSIVFNEGDLLLAVGPLASQVDGDGNELRCNRCCKGSSEGKRLMQCSGCKVREIL